MSTKIYYGMLIRETTIEEVKEKIESLKEKYIEKVKGRYIRSLSNHYYLILDGHEGSVENSVFSELQKEIKKAREQLEKGYRSPDFDFEVIITLKEMNGNVYGSIFSENNSITEELYKDLNIEEYGYWNNTDEPEGVTATAWEIRKNTWDKLLNGAYSFSKAGFEDVKIVDNEDLFNLELTYEDLKDYDMDIRIKRYIAYELPSMISDRDFKDQEFSISLYNNISYDCREGKYKKEEAYITDLFKKNCLMPTKENYKELKGLKGGLWKK